MQAVLSGGAVDAATPGGSTSGAAKGETASESGSAVAVTEQVGLELEAAEEDPALVDGRSVYVSNVRIFEILAF